jgi:hypothetical protein
VAAFQFKLSGDYPDLEIAAAVGITTKIGLQTVIY